MDEVLPDPICTEVAVANRTPLMVIEVPIDPEEGVTEVTDANPETTVMVILLEVAVVGLAHTALLVKTQVTICPLVRVVVVKVEMLVPAFTPFTFH